jgi:ribokinase
VNGLLSLPRRPRFRAMVGTGGIGYGTFFLLDGSQTLGREESRAGRFLDRRDYCKLHIISHYVKVLLGETIDVYPVGRVGDDHEGSRLCSEMEGVGVDMRFVHRVPGAPTLFSFCFVYPDGSGGNLSTKDSASSRVDASALKEAEPRMRELAGDGIALAVPEVPLAARRALLEAATASGMFRVASFTRAEMEEVRASRLLEQVDLCALNLEEAAAAAGIAGERSSEEPGLIARNVVRALRSEYPRLQLSVTAGKHGSWAGDSDGLHFDPAVRVEAEGTSGAGDAHVSGVIAGLAAGLALQEALELGTIVASASVTSPHTIHPRMDADLLRAVCRRRNRVKPSVAALLDTANGGS